MHSLTSYHHLRFFERLTGMSAAPDSSSYNPDGEDQPALLALADDIDHNSVPTDPTDIMPASNPQSSPDSSGLGLVIDSQEGPAVAATARDVGERLEAVNTGGSRTVRALDHREKLTSCTFLAGSPRRVDIQRNHHGQPRSRQGSLVSHDGRQPFPYPPTRFLPSILPFAPSEHPLPPKHDRFVPPLVLGTFPPSPHRAMPPQGRYFPPPSFAPYPMSPVSPTLSFDYGYGSPPPPSPSLLRSPPLLAHAQSTPELRQPFSAPYRPPVTIYSTPDREEPYSPLTVPQTADSPVCFVFSCFKLSACEIAPCGCRICREHLRVVIQSAKLVERQDKQMKIFECAACGAMSTTVGPNGVATAQGDEQSAHQHFSIRYTNVPSDERDQLLDKLKQTTTLAPPSKAPSPSSEPQKERVKHKERPLSSHADYSPFLHPATASTASLETRSSSVPPPETIPWSDAAAHEELDARINVPLGRERPDRPQGYDQSALVLRITRVSHTCAKTERRSTELTNYRNRSLTVPRSMTLIGYFL